MAKSVIDIIDGVLRAKSKDNYQLARDRCYATPHTQTFVVRGTADARISSLPALADEIEEILAYEGIFKAVSYRRGPSRFEIDTDSPPTVTLRSQWEYVKRRIKENEFKFLPFFIYDGKEAKPLSPSIAVARNVHLMFCGSTGSGKTVAARSSLASLLMANSPDVLSVFICDPNGTGYNSFASTPHMAGSIAIEHEEILGTVRSVHGEMERRKRLRDPLIANRRVLLLIDEINDQIDDNPEIVPLLTSILRRGRGLGIHVWVVGQKVTAAMPTAMRVNIQARMVGRLDSSEDAKRTCGEDSQAHKLLVEKGFFEFRNGKPFMGSEITRVYGYYCDTDDADFFAKEISDRWSGRKNHMDLLEIERQEKISSVCSRGDHPTPHVLRREYEKASGMSLNYDRAIRIWEQIVGRKWQKRTELQFA